MLCCIIPLILAFIYFVVSKCREGYAGRPRTRIYRAPFAELPDGSNAVGVVSGVVVADMTHTWGPPGAEESCDLCPDCSFCPECPQCK